jgi:ATP-binding protein involved in chromosome partitioning
VSQQYGVKILARIPLDLEIQRGGDEGKPVVATRPDGVHTRAFLELADAVVETCPYQSPAKPGEGGDKKRGFLSSLFKR